MSVSFDPGFFVAFLLASTRCAAWLTISPPFAGVVPAKVRASLAVALGLAIAPQLAQDPDLPTHAPALLGAVLFQAAVGLGLGFLVFVIFQAISSAGSAIDMFAGLSASMLYDPTTRSTASPMGRLYQMLGMVVLFLTGGHLLLVAGLVRSFDAAPVAGFHIDRMAELATNGVGMFLLATVQIAAPLLGALFVTELLLGLASRAAPQLNIMVVGFGVKGIVLVMLASAAFPLVVLAIPDLTTRAVELMWALVR
jgi:flagellar biosynthetic protein FliR